MGAINYGCNDIINLGYNLKNYDYEKDFDICNDDYIQIKWLLKSLNFEFYIVELRGGYYEGFYLNIDFRLLWLDNYQEKLAALKETTMLHKFLKACINDFSVVVYYPGWGTSYEDKKTSLKMLKNAIREEKEKIRKLRTDKTLTMEEFKNFCRG